MSGEFEGGGGEATIGQQSASESGFSRAPVTLRNARFCMFYFFYLRIYSGASHVAPLRERFPKPVK